MLRRLLLLHEGTSAPGSGLGGLGSVCSSPAPSVRSLPATPGGLSRARARALGFPRAARNQISPRGDLGVRDLERQAGLSDAGFSWCV